MTKDYDKQMQKFEAMEKSLEGDGNKQETELCEAIYLKDCYEHKCSELELVIHKLQNELQIEKDRANRLELFVCKPCRDCEFNNSIA